MVLLFWQLSERNILSGAWVLLFRFYLGRRRCCELLSISDLSFFGLCFLCLGGMKGPGVPCWHFHVHDLGIDEAGI